MLNPATPETISLNGDLALKKCLRLKRAEYKQRLRTRRNNGMPKTLQMDVVFKIAILDLLLEYGKIRTLWLAEIMAGEYDAAFDPLEFTNAALVINDYCHNGGKNTRLGTGLQRSGRHVPHVFL